MAGIVGSINSSTDLSLLLPSFPSAGHLSSDEAPDWKTPCTPCLVTYVSARLMPRGTPNQTGVGITDMAQCDFVGICPPGQACHLSSSVPDEVPTHSKASAEPRTSAFIDRPLGNGPLGLDAGDDPVQVGLDDDTPHYHLSQRGV